MLLSVLQGQLRVRGESLPAPGVPQRRVCLSRLYSVNRVSILTGLMLGSAAMANGQSFVAAVRNGVQQLENPGPGKKGRN